VLQKPSMNRWAKAAFVFLIGLGSGHAQSVYTPYAFTNFAGQPGVYGTNDATGSAAGFGTPLGIAVDNAGNLYVTDQQANTVRKIAPTGVVTTLAGSPGQHGTNDGMGSTARFYSPQGVAVDSLGNVYVADRLNSMIRKISPAGAVTTLASTDAQFNQPAGVAVDTVGNVYVSDTGNFTIRKVTPAGLTTTLAGRAGEAGTNDGAAAIARFFLPNGIAVDSNTNVYVSDYGNNTIRKITSDGLVTTLAGRPGYYGSADGAGSAAGFGVWPGYGAWGVAVDSAGNVFVADHNNMTIRRVTPLGVVTTIAGNPGQSGSADGEGSTARFNSAYGVAVDSWGNVYVADTLNNRITKGAPVLQFDTSAGCAGVADSSFHARLIGPSSNNVVIEASADFRTWLPVQTNSLDAGRLEMSVSLGASPWEFFRARIAP
jgi:sugar lactone lactonase YvrE